MSLNDLTALGVAIDTLKNIHTIAQDAWLEGRKIDALCIKIQTENTLARIKKLRAREK